MDDELRGVVRGPVVFVEEHRRTPRPVVEQLIDIEPGDFPVIEGVQQVPGGQPYRVAGVDVPGQRVNENQRRIRRVRRWCAADGVQVRGIQHDTS